MLGEQILDKQARFWSEFDHGFKIVCDKLARSANVSIRFQAFLWRNQHVRKVSEIKIKENVIIPEKLGNV